MKYLSLILIICCSFSCAIQRATTVDLIYLTKEATVDSVTIIYEYELGRFYQEKWREEFGDDFELTREKIDFPTFRAYSREALGSHRYQEIKELGYKKILFAHLDRLPNYDTDSTYFKNIKIEVTAYNNK